MGKEVDAANKDAVSVLKKIKASNGKLQGNFYFVGKADGSEAGIVLTISAKDKKGQKAKGAGKKLRGEIKGSKFAAGLVQMIDGKLTFILHGGSASKAHMKAGFKKTLSNEAGLKSLLKAVFKTADNEEESAEEISLSEAEEQNAALTEQELADEELSASEREELLRLEEEQAEIMDLSSQLSNFLSRDIELEEHRDQLKAGQEALQHLVEAVNSSPEDIQQARAELAETMNIGSNIDITPERPLPAEITQLLNLSAENIYNEHRRELKPTIDRATADAMDFGGAEVQKLFEEAESAAQSGQYSLAVDKIADAHDKALEVLERLPFVIAYNTHHIAIKAAENIKKKVTDARYLMAGSPALPWNDEAPKVTYGAEVEREWKKVLQYRSDRDWENAKKQIDQVAEYVGSLKIALEDELQENEKRAEASQREMKAMLALLANANTPADRAEALRLLKEAALEELACAKEAKSLGLDPAIEMSIPYSLEEDEKEAKKNKRPTCEEKFKTTDWFAIKDQFHAYDEKKAEYDSARASSSANADALQRELVDKDFMTQLWKYRQQRVEGLINSLRKKYPNLIAKASGSTDLESDIDITFATAASGEDVLAAKEFNETILSAFSKPPGRTFDVNIYIREYGPGIKESFNEFYGLEGNKDSNLEDSENEETQKLTQIDMDVATLLKQRRFLPQNQFTALMNDVLSGMKEDTQKKVRQKYDEAEAVYFETLRDKLDGIESRLQAISTDPDQEEARIAQAEKALVLIAKIRTEEDPALFQNQLQSTIESLETDFPALTMEATDQMYLDRMGIVRQNEQTVRELMENETESQKLYQAQKPVDRNGDPIAFEEWRERKLEALRIQIKKDIITNIIFANEAYVSEGAIKHVVQTGQARDKSPEEKLQIILDMPVANLVQSTNEQLADFFKDMAHSIHEVEERREAGEENEASRLEGEAYVHASKYVVRMLGAAQALALKYENDNGQANLQIKWFTDEIDASVFSGLSDQSPLSDKIKMLEKRIDDLLYQLRKSGTIPQSVKGELAVEEIKTVFKVSSIEDFTGKFRQLGVELNNSVRQRDDFLAEQDVDEETVSDYILLREETDSEKGENLVNKCCANPLVNKKEDLKKGLVLLQIEEQSAISVSDGWSDSLSKLEAYRDTSQTEATRQVLLGWKTAINAVSNSILKNTVTQLYDAVLLECNLKTVKLETGNNAIPKTLQKADLFLKQAQFLFYKTIPSTLKQWVTPTEEENRVQVIRERASRKEVLMTKCVQTGADLRGLIRDLSVLKEDLEHQTILDAIDKKITLLTNHRNRALELNQKLMTHPLILKESE